MQKNKTLGIKKIFFLLLFFSCHNKKHVPLTYKIKKMKSSVLKQIPKNDTLLEGIKYERVQGRLKGNFFVVKQFSPAKINSCKECHKGQNLKFNHQAPRSHWQIKLDHASIEIMDCKTCHIRKRVWNLKNIKGKKLSINQAYNICTQCHSGQGNDWKHGAHGKRVGGWASTRVIKSCTGCHNPHSPKFEKRWPAIGPNIQL